MDTSSFLELVGDGDVDAVREALAGDPSLASTADESSTSPILTALYRQNREMIELLLEHATLNLAEAAALGDLGAVRMLLADDPGGVGRFTADGWTPLHLAAFFGRLDVAQALVAAGASLGEGADSRNYMANRPLHAALAGAGDEETIRYLLEAGAGVGDRAATGVTPLHLAASRGNLPIVEALLERGADASIRMDSGETPADIARERGHPDVAERLEG